ncbi:hypothetical protein [Vibrio viridaestus]|uniref:DNA polymerase III subunit beta n=1 Tax=Vibrio viridaestus TaxID=2487322 RepID=A0A3N9TFH7_9VIBR|nr:hypothetical protein [Vibrio viridaestus]RQW62991.1 hypothetical protein EES38_11790 [Vibrio viridaestus]
MKTFALVSLLGIALSGCSSVDYDDLDGTPRFSEITGEPVEVSSNVWVDDIDNQDMQSDDIKFKGEVLLSSESQLPADYRIKNLIIYQEGKSISLSEDQFEIDISTENQWTISFTLSGLNMQIPIDVLVLFSNDSDEAWLIDKKVVINTVE